MARENKSKQVPLRGVGRPSSDEVLDIEFKLLSVALQEFLDKGYGNASLERIVKQARVSKTTLYSRYPSKEHLFRAVVYQQISRIDPGAILRVDTSAPNLVEGLKAYANKMLELNLQGDMLEVNRLINSEASRFPELGAAAAERTRLGIERIEQFIKSCAEADAIACKAPKVVAEVFILLIRGWYTNVMLTNQPVSPKERKQWVDGAVNTLIASRSDW